MRTRVARRASGGIEQRGGGPDTLSLYQHDMNAGEAARRNEARGCVGVGVVVGEGAGRRCKFKELRTFDLQSKCGRLCGLHGIASTGLSQ